MTCSEERTELSPSSGSPEFVYAESDDIKTIHWGNKIHPINPKDSDIFLEKYYNTKNFYVDEERYVYVDGKIKGQFLWFQQVA